MTQEKAESFAALGQALNAAHADGVLASDEYAALAGKLAVGILTGSMGMEEYLSVHEALALILEAAFNGSAPPFEGDDGGEMLLGAELEVVEQVCEDLPVFDEATDTVAAFVAECFDLAQARFSGAGWFSAPLKLSADDVQQALRRSGLAILSRDGEIRPDARRAALAPAGASNGRGRLALGWGERRLDLIFLDEAAA